MFWSSTQNLANTEFLITWFCYFFIIFKFFAYAHEIEEKKKYWMKEQMELVCRYFYLSVFHRTNWILNEQREKCDETDTFRQQQAPRNLVVWSAVTQNPCNEINYFQQLCIAHRTIWWRILIVEPHTYANCRRSLVSPQSKRNLVSSEFNWSLLSYVITHFLSFCVLLWCSK